MKLPENLKVLEYRDFRLMWTGAFLSFLGSWIQSFAQGYLVYDLTGSKAKLALIGFVANIPVFFIGPIAGAVSDTFDRRKTLIVCQSIFGLNALFLFYSIQTKTIIFEHFLIVAFINGLAAAIEMPARQSIVAKTVPPELVSSAVPLTAMTFNTARIIGPVVGALVLKYFGDAACYLLNGISYLALIAAVLAVKAELNADTKEAQPVGDLLMEGIRFTLHHPTLRLLLVLETIVSMFAIFYINMLPAFSKDVLKQTSDGLSQCYVAIGIGAICGLAMMISQAKNPNKIKFIFIAMGSLGSALLALSFVRSPWIYFPLFAVLGFGTLVHFNTTNSLFQTLSPDRLRGRVLAMHVWALSGIGPMFLPVVGAFAEHNGTPKAFEWGALITLTGWAIGLLLFLKSKPAQNATFVQ